MASNAPNQTAKRPRVHYTALIRLPFARGDFVDPPLVDWDSSRDKALWKILSKRSKGSDLDWQDIARRFDVTLSFILQQAAWLYERHLEEVRQQMQKINAAAASPINAAAARPPRTLSSPTDRPGTSEALQTAMNAATAQVDTPKGTEHVPTSRSRGNSYQAQAPSMSRTTSSNTITQSQNHAGSPTKLGSKVSRRGLSVSPRQRYITMHSARSRNTESRERSSSSTQDTSESESSSEKEPRGHLGKSQVFRRAPNFGAGKDSKAKGTVTAETDSEDEEPALFTFGGPPGRTGQDMRATVLQEEKGKPPRREPINVVKITSREGTDSSVSSAASSAAPVASPNASSAGERRPGALSPGQRAKVAGASPGRRAAGGKDGNEDTPSMGSSFSDLDDASVTQSALEEALMSNMQHGGIGSRMSNISQAFRSRYT